MSLPRCLWGVQASVSATPSATLLLLPHSGGSAQAFRGWGDWFPGEVRVLAVQFPGRASRLREPLATGLAQLVDELRGAASDLPGPLAVFGHSLGAFVGFEFCWLLQQDGRSVSAFFPSAAIPLHLHRPCARSPRDLTDEESLALLRRYGGIPADLNAEPELLRRALRICRSDIGLAHDYTFGPEQRRIRTPIIALGGDADPIVPARLLDDWQELSTGGGATHTFPGGHFYHLDNTPAVTAVLRDRLLQRIA
jgi:pyochelin biosynthesis protein PchC